MAKAWPFENRIEGDGRARTPEDHIRVAGTAFEAVVIRIGLHDAQLVLVDEHGDWRRWVYTSVDEAAEAARALGLEVTVGEYPEHLRVAMSSRRKGQDELARGAYPEQGRVGPIIPYPENRPLRPEDDQDEEPKHPPFLPP